MTTFKIVIILTVLICLSGIASARLPQVGDTRVEIHTIGPMCILEYHGTITDIDDTMIGLNCTVSLSRTNSGSSGNHVYGPYNVTIGKGSIISMEWHGE